MVKVRETWHAAVHRVSRAWQDLATEKQQNDGLPKPVINAQVPEERVELEPWMFSKTKRTHAA